MRCALAILACTTLAAADPTYRDPMVQPFASNSIWNTPIGSGAVYAPANINPSSNTWFGGDMETHVIVNAGDPWVQLREPSGNPRWPGGNVLGTMQIPYNLYLRDCNGGDTPNMCTSFILPDRRTVAQLQPACRITPGAQIVGYRNRDVDIYGSGESGTHWGSGLSTLGGSIRRGELSNNDPFRHVLKVNLYAAQYYYYGADRQGYRWPADRADSYASGVYRGPDRKLCAGSLLAIPPNVTAASLGITRPLAIKFFNALRDYGAYIVDDTYWDAVCFSYEYGAPEEAQAFFGETPEAQNSPLVAEFKRMFTALNVVDNNDATHIGGGGTPRQPLLPLLADPAYAVPGSVTAAGPAGAVVVRWSDPSNNEDGFEIHRRSGGGAWASVATPAANSTSWTDAAATGGTTWDYRVRLLKSPSASNWSATVSCLPTGGDNTAPTVSTVSNQTINENAATGALAVTVGDAQTAAGSLTLTASAADATLLPASGISVGGSGANRTITLTPAGSRTGSTLVTLTVSDGSLSSTSSFTLNVQPVSGSSGQITREYWTGITGNGVASIPLSSPPAGTAPLTSLEGPSNWGDNYGSRIRGYLQPTVSGSYTFWLATDDDGELWLSTDDQPSTKQRIASVSGWTGVREWNKFPSQKSAALTLVAGRRYYLEVLQKEGIGGDNLAVGWATPGQGTTTPSDVIPGSVLSAFSGTTVPTNTAPTVNAGLDRSISQGASTNLTGIATDDGLPAPAALTASWTRLSGPGTVTFSNAGALSTSVGFSAAGTYVLQLSVSDGALSASDTVQVTVNASGGATAITREYWTGITGNGVASIPLLSPPTGTAPLTSLEGPSNWGDNYGTRIRGYLQPTVSGSYTFWLATDDDGELWLSTDDQPSTKQRIASVSGWTSSREWNKYPSQKSAALTLVAGRRYYLEVLHKEGGGGDNLAVGWATPGQGTTTPSEVVPGSVLSGFGGTTVETFAWANRDVGSTGMAGSTSSANGTFTVSGSGADIWGTADAFQFASQPLTGDGTIVARIVSLQNTDAWAKAGVMMREGTAAGARHAFCGVTAANGVAFQRRIATNDTSSHTAGSLSAAPRWVKLVRQGSLVTGYESADGVTWTTVGSTTISMANPVQIGLAVTSHNTAVLCTAVFDNVVVTPGGNG